MTTDGSGVLSWTELMSTDDQSLTTPTLMGTTLSLGIEDGTGTSIDLAGLQDGSGTDDQNLTTPTLQGTKLHLGIEDGMGDSIDLAPLVFWTDTSSSATLQKLGTEGWVGIGTTNPSGPLHIKSTNTSSTFSSKMILEQTDNNQSGQVKFRTNYGDVGEMGIWGGDLRLALYNLGPFSKDIILDNNSTFGNILFETNNQTRLSIESDGDVSIGGLFSSYELFVDGQAAKPGGGSWSTSSDRRLKKNITIYDRGLADILAINPVTFQYNELANVKDTDKVYTGVIAQELQEIAPEMVSLHKVAEDSEEYLSVDPSDLTYMLINAVKELKAENEALQASIRQLQSEVTSFKD